MRRQTDQRFARSISAPISPISWRRAVVKKCIPNLATVNKPGNVKEFDSENAKFACCDHRFNIAIARLKISKWILNPRLSMATNDAASREQMQDH